MEKKREMSAKVHGASRDRESEAFGELDDFTAMGGSPAAVDEEGKEKQHTRRHWHEKNHIKNGRRVKRLQGIQSCYRRRVTSKNK